MRLALLSDIHGNLHALREVLVDVDSQGVDQIVNLGDSLSGPLLPRETAELLMAQPWIQLAGNHERQLLRFDAATGGESDRYALSRLTPSILDWLASLKPNADLPGGIHLCHGTPRSDHQYFLESVDPAGIRPATAQEVEDRMAGVSARLIACGHTHVPRVIRSRNGTLIVNPGSVGLPAYDDDQPYPHGSRRGRRTLATPSSRSGTEPCTSR